MTSSSESSMAEAGAPARGGLVRSGPTPAHQSEAARDRIGAAFIIMALLTVCAGYANMSVMPLWTEALIRSAKGSETVVLLCGSVELGGGACAALLYSRLGLSFRVSTILRTAAAILALADLASVVLIGSHHLSLPLFGLSRFIAGAGSGAILAAVNARITRTRFAERLFIGAHIAFGLFASGVFQVLPPMMAAAQARGVSGAQPVLLAVGGLACLIALAASLIDGTDSSRQGAGVANHRLTSVNWLYLVMLMSFFCGFTSIYTFWERFGAHAGLSMAVVAEMLSAASLIALVGLGGALLVAKRIGFVGPIFFCLVLLSLSAWISSHGGVLPPPLGHYLFGGAVVADQTSAIVIVPFVLMLMAAQDPSGAVTAAAPSAMSIGNVVGPTLATLVARTSYSNIGWLVIGFYTFGFVILVFGRRLRSRGSQSASASLSPA